MTKKYTITKQLDYTMQPDADSAPSYTFEGSEAMQVSDGYHTMDELYEHRIALWIALCKQVQDISLVDTPNGPSLNGKRVWRSKLHDDGSEHEGWFVLGIGKKKGEIMTYHLPMSKWDECAFAETLERAPEWDGHTAADVLERLKNL